MTDHEQAQARSEIRHLQSIYNTSGDRAKIDDLVATFTDDGVLEVPNTRHEGHAAILAFLSNVAATGSDSVDLRGSRHHLTTSRIEFDDTAAAQGWTYFFVMRAGQMLQEGTYIDRYIRTAQGWRLAHRRVKILWSLER
ncbi:MAG: hypothetical protein CVT77_00280 [Alphaproteobacteria bacterium HGW-Alphaproteobacteria-16]|nr:MAG: hypothetical protein CVT77_00280 [Alphaproteobacteria bacterium HGW-Alphaproteobacteria-16]